MHRHAGPWPRATFAPVGAGGGQRRVLGAAGWRRRPTRMAPPALVSAPAAAPIRPRSRSCWAPSRRPPTAAARPRPPAGSRCWAWWPTATAGRGADRGRRQAAAALPGRRSGGDGYVLQSVDTRAATLGASADGAGRSRCSCPRPRPRSLPSSRRRQPPAGDAASAALTARWLRPAGTAGRPGWRFLRRRDSPASRRKSSKAASSAAGHLQARPGCGRSRRPGCGSGTG